MIQLCIKTAGKAVKGLSGLLFALSLISVSMHAKAVELTGLYEVELPVESQSQQDRKQVSGLALERVIQRITGDRLAFAEPAVRSALKSPESYLQQFSYIQDEETGMQSLRLVFDESLVNRFLRQAKQPIWGNNRPSLMTWVAIEGAGERFLVNAGDESVWRDAINQAAGLTGLPVLLPLMDLEDETSISVTEVWGLFRSQLERASERYRAESVLGGRLYQVAPEQWAGRWLFILNGEAMSFTSQPTAIENSSTEVMEWVARIMVDRYAIDTALQSDRKITLVVHGINSLEDYARVQSYLSGFAMVREVAVSHVDGQRLTLVVDTEGEWEQLQGLLALDKQLQPLAEEAVDNVTAIPYRWQP